MNHRVLGDKKMPIPTMIQLHTITAGPPVVYDSSGNKALAYL